MNIMDFFSSHSCMRLAFTLMHFLWQGMAIALLTFLAANIIGKNSARTRYGIHVLGLAAMVLALGVTYLLVDLEPQQVSIEPATVCHTFTFSGVAHKG